MAYPNGTKKCFCIEFTSTTIGETEGEPDISVPKATGFTKTPSNAHVVDLAIVSSDYSAGPGENSDNLYFDQSDLSVSNHIHTARCEIMCASIIPVYDENNV